MNDRYEVPLRIAVDLIVVVIALVLGIYLGKMSERAAAVDAGAAHYAVDARSGVLRFHWGPPKPVRVSP